MNFENFPSETNIVSKIFHSREDFEKKVKKTLNWRDKGGPEVGTSSFVKAITGKINLNSDEFASIKKEIGKEIKKIRSQEKREEEQENGEEEKKLKPKGRAFTEEETQMMIKDSEKKEWRELKRSGGVDPNEI